MAAIDKMYLRSYYDFDRFRLWCLINKPSLLLNFYNWNMTEAEWDKWKEETYNNQLETYRKNYYDSSTVEHLREKYKKFDYDVSDEQLESEVKYFLEIWDKLQDKDSCIDGYALPVANFRIDQDKYLFWHCPLDFIRDYITDWCGYKEKWYHKLLFELTWKNEDD